MQGFIIYCLEYCLIDKVATDLISLLMGEINEILLEGIIILLCLHISNLPAPFINKYSEEVHKFFMLTL